MKTTLRTALALVFCMTLFLCLNSSAFAENIDSGTWGDLTWSLNENYVLTISGNGDMNAFGTDIISASNDAWRKYTSYITSVNIENGVTSIGTCAFYNCRKLTSITIPVSIISIGRDAFSYCTNLTSITIPSRVISIGWRSFADCKNLSNVNIPSGVKTIDSYAFVNCSSLSSITIPVSVIKIGECAFFNCDSIEVYYGGTREQWGKISYGCGIGVNSPKVHCGNYQILVDPNIRKGQVTVKVNDVEDIYACPGDIVSLTIIPERAYANIYYKLDTLTVKEDDIVIPVSDNSFIMPKGDVIVSAVFYVSGGYGNSIGKFLEWKLNSEGTLTFTGNSTMYTMSPSNSQYTTAQLLTWRNFSSDIIKVVINQGIVNIGTYNFYNCKNLTSITIPKSVTTIGEGAFSGCNSLKDVYYEGTKTQWNAIAINEDNYSSLNNAQIHYNSQGVFVLPEPDFVLPSGLTGIGDEAFRGDAFTCVSLSDNTVSIGAYAFADCENLQYIYIPQETKNIDPFAFGDLSGLTIIGFSGSTAEKYALEHDFSFYAIQ